MEGELGLSHAIPEGWPPPKDQGVPGKALWGDDTGAPLASQRLAFLSLCSACVVSSPHALPLWETLASASPCLGGPTAAMFYSPSPMEAETRELFLEQEQLHNK